MRSKKSSANEPQPGITLRQTLKGHESHIHRLAWFAEHGTLASTSGDNTVRLWDTSAGKLLRTFNSGSDVKWGETFAVAWSPDGKTLAAGGTGKVVQLWSFPQQKLLHSINCEDNVASLLWSPGGDKIIVGVVGELIKVFDAKTGQQVGRLTGHTSTAMVMSLSPDKQVLATGSIDSTVRLWEQETGKVIRVLKGNSKRVNTLTWSPNGQALASGYDDSTIRIWNPKTGRLRRILEGHTGEVSSLAFSGDGRVLVSKGMDGTLRIWRCDSWQTVATLPELDVGCLASSICFCGDTTLIAVPGQSNTINILNLDLDVIFKTSHSVNPSYYANAKVVLVGDSGVGKSGLGLVLSGQEFTPTESTHGRRVWTMQRRTVKTSGSKELREVLLWDLAGQQGYRLVHQLHLNEVAIALIVFDAGKETDPFSGVRYWRRALRQAHQINAETLPSKVFLVAARIDRASLGVSKERVQELTRELGLDGYFETSAKERLGLEPLVKVIRKSIDWQAVPKVSSTALFESIKNFLVKTKKEGRLLCTADELYRSFLDTAGAELKVDKELAQHPAQFNTCIGLVEARGLIRRLGFGNLILLQPELLDSYASAIVNAAKDEPDGMGCILEDEVKNGTFVLSEEERISEKEHERLLLLATVEDMLRHEVALRENADDGTLLVFPSQFTRDNPELPDPPGKAVVFRFEGPIVNIYTTLAIRLSRSGLFQRKEMWRNAATFTTRAGGTCGMFLHEREEGHAELTLFFPEPLPGKETRLLFETYVYTHLTRRAIANSVTRHPIFICSGCETPISERMVSLRRERGFNWMTCGVCETRISLDDRSAPASDKESMSAMSGVHKMDEAADLRREREAARARLEGKIATQDFDVFLAHSNEDKPQVLFIAEKLKLLGIYPWVDKEQVAPGRWFQEAIEQAIPRVKTAAVFIGPGGMGRWQKVELRAFVSRCVEEAVPVIPVLLPGVDAPPNELPFLRELNWVSFRESLEEPTAIGNLVWGITGERLNLDLLSRI